MRHAEKYQYGRVPGAGNHPMQIPTQTIAQPQPNAQSRPVVQTGTLDWNQDREPDLLTLPTEVSYFARQPIFNTSLEVMGHEVLYRCGPERHARFSDPTLATLSVISSVFFSLGRDAVAGSRMLFLNVGTEILDDERVTLLPPRQLALEILEDVALDSSLLKHCENLRAAGFRIALDDVVSVAQIGPMHRHVDYAKIDFLNLDLAQRREVCQVARAFRLPMIAEKVETYEDFRQARDLGCQYFQGFFFAKPNLVRANRVKGSRNHHLRVLSELSAPELDFDRLEELMRQDLSLSWLFFRFLNSAQFAWSSEIRSLRHAFALLGAENLKKWILIAVVPYLAADKPHELVVESLLRARFCELIAESSKLYSRAPDLFLVGLFSVLDAILDQPLPKILEDLQLPSEIRDVLLLNPAANPWMREAALLAQRYASLSPEELRSQCLALGIEESAVAAHYFAADVFARQVFQMTN